MSKYIDKSALVAEIEKLISNGKIKCQQSQENNDQASYIAWSEHIATCGKILSFLDTLEVKDENTIKRDWHNKGYLKWRKEANIPARDLGLPSELNTFEMKDGHLKKDANIEDANIEDANIEDAVHGTVDYPIIGCDFPNIYPNYKELKEYCDRKGIKDNDKVKLIIIKDM